MVKNVYFLASSRAQICIDFQRKILFKYLYAIYCYYNVNKKFELSLNIEIEIYVFYQYIFFDIVLL